MRKYERESRNSTRGNKSNLQVWDIEGEVLGRGLETEIFEDISWKRWRERIGKQDK